MGNKKIPDKVIEEAIVDNFGLVLTTAKALGIQPNALRYRIRNSPVLEKALKDARELIVDKAEDKLFDCIDRGERWAIALVLTTLGRDRGYATSSSGSSGGISLNLTADDVAQARKEAIEWERKRFEENMTS